MSKQLPLKFKFFDESGKLLEFVNTKNVEVVAITTPHNLCFYLFYR